MKKTPTMTDWPNCPTCHKPCGYRTYQRGAPWDGSWICESCGVQYSPSMRTWVLNRRRARKRALELRERDIRVEADYFYDGGLSHFQIPDAPTPKHTVRQFQDAGLI